MSRIPNWFVMGIAEARSTQSDEKFWEMGNGLAHHANACLQAVDQDAEAAAEELVQIWRDHQNAEADMRVATEGWLRRWLDAYVQLVPVGFRPAFVDGFMPLMEDEPAL